MDAQTFDKFLQTRLDKIKKVLGIKAGEYASTKDRLHNFNRGAEILGTTPETVCLGFLTKHLVSILDIVEEISKGNMSRIGFVDEKLGDTVNYFILLWAILEDKLKTIEDESADNNKQEPTKPIDDNNVIFKIGDLVRVKGDKTKADRMVTSVVNLDTGQRVYCEDGHIFSSSELTIVDMVVFRT